MPTKEQIRKSVLKEVTQEENRIFAIMFVIFFTAFMIMSMFEGMMGKKTYAILFFAFALVCAVIGSIAFLNSGEWKRRKK